MMLPRFEMWKGRSILLLDPPYELLGDFLTMEGMRLDSWPLSVILPAVESILRQEIEEYSYGGDAYNVEVSREGAVVYLVVSDPWEECRVPLEEFHEMLILWQERLNWDNSTKNAL